MSKKSKLLEELGKNFKDINIEEMKRMDTDVINFPDASSGVLIPASLSLFAASGGELNPKRLNLISLNLR